MRFGKGWGKLYCNLGERAGRGRVPSTESQKVREGADYGLKPAPREKMPSPEALSSLTLRQVTWDAAALAFFQHFHYFLGQSATVRMNEIRNGVGGVMFAEQNSRKHLGLG